MIAQLLERHSERRRARYVGPHDLNTPVGRLMYLIEDKPLIKYGKTLYTIDIMLEIVIRPRRARVLFTEWRNEIRG